MDFCLLDQPLLSIQGPPFSASIPSWEVMCSDDNVWGGERESALLLEGREGNEFWGIRISLCHSVDSLLQNYPEAVEYSKKSRAFERNTHLGVLCFSLYLCVILTIFIDFYRLQFLSL